MSFVRAAGGVLGQQGGGAAFVPTDIAGCVGWWDASDTATITDTAGAVDEWADKSSAGNNLTGTTTTRPSTGAVTINSLNAISMTADQFVSKTGTAVCASAMSVFVVFRKTGASSTFEAHPLTLNASNQGRPFDYWDNGASNRVFVETTFASGQDLRGLTTTSLLATVLVKDGVSSGTHSVIQRLDGSEVTNSSITASWSITGQGIYVGRRADGATKFTGDIGEIVLYESEVTGTDLTEVEGYLATKWGTTL